jgi:hypothetical protein
MKRIVQTAAVAVLVLGAQVAWSGENITLPPEAYFNVAQMGSASESEAAVVSETRSVHTRAPILEELGLAGVGPFPSRGGPLDD